MVIGQDRDANGQPVFPPVGVPDNQLDRIQQELLAACQLIQPPYFPALTVEEVEGRKLVVLQAPGGMHRPYKAPASADEMSVEVQARMTRDALSFIQRNYLIETVLKHPDRAEATRVWNFPYVAIEEAVVNAVYHRSYEEREPIEVRISYDELVILSFPGPDRSIKTEDFEAGRSTGVPKILKAMAANGSPAPRFETDDVIEMTLPDKPRSSNQRYRLTRLGQRWLDAHSGGGTA